MAWGAATGFNGRGWIVEETLVPCAGRRWVGPSKTKEQLYVVQGFGFSPDTDAIGSPRQRETFCPLTRPSHFNSFEFFPTPNLPQVPVLKKIVYPLLATMK
jgi:hypothetical protein